MLMLLALTASVIKELEIAGKCDDARVRLGYREAVRLKGLG